LAQFIKQFGPVFHLLVSKLDALRPYCIGRLGVGKHPNIVVDSEMGKRPKRIDSHKAVVVKHKLIKQFL